MRCIILIVLVLSLHVWFLYTSYLSGIVKQKMQRNPVQCCSNVFICCTNWFRFKDSSLLGWDTVSGEFLSTFQRIVMPSVFKVRQSQGFFDCLTQETGATTCSVTYQKTWLFSSITVRTADLWFPVVHSLLQRVVTVCVPCSLWCTKWNWGNRLQDAKPSVHQLLFDCTGHNVNIAVGACEKVDLLRGN